MTIATSSTATEEGKHGFARGAGYIFTHCRPTAIGNGHVVKGAIACKGNL
jgi:hypothetical protein